MAGEKRLTQSGQLSQSQSSQNRKSSQSQRKISYTLTELRAKELKKNCVNYILMAMNKNEAIRKSDVVQLALEKESRALPVIWDDVVKSLKEIFGFIVYSDNVDEEGRSLKSVPDKFFVRSEGDDFTENKDILMKKLAKEQIAKTALLLQVLAVVFMKGDSCTEDVLFKFMERLGFDEYVDKKIISEEFCRGQYLIREITDGENPIVTYKRGFRAEAEVSREELLTYVSGILKKSPEKFREQKALIVEQQRIWNMRSTGENGDDERD